MRGLRLLLVVLALVVGAAAAAAAEPPAGTKNFSAPSGVPNYFSNEAGAPMGHGGIVHPFARGQSFAAESPRAPARMAARRHSSRHHVASRGRHRATRLAAAKSRHRPAKVAAAKAKPAKTASARSGSERETAARAPAQAEAQPIKAAVPNRPAPAKAKPAPHHAG